MLLVLSAHHYLVSRLSYLGLQNKKYKDADA
jgi:hypothetical protein